MQKNQTYQKVENVSVCLCHPVSVDVSVSVRLQSVNFFDDFIHI